MEWLASSSSRQGVDCEGASTSWEFGSTLVKRSVSIDTRRRTEGA
jgi:hypothetical protein